MIETYCCLIGLLPLEKELPESTSREGESATDWNARVNNYLAATGIVDSELYNGSVHVHNYDAVTSVG